MMLSSSGGCRRTTAWASTTAGRLSGLRQYLRGEWILLVVDNSGDGTLRYYTLPGPLVSAQDHGTGPTLDVLSEILYEWSDAAVQWIDITVSAIISLLTLLPLLL